MTCGYREFIEMVLAWRVRWLWQLYGLFVSALVLGIAGGLIVGSIGSAWLLKLLNLNW